MIKTLIFDLGKVIIPFDFKRSYDRMAALCRYPADQIPERIRSTNLVTRLETGTIEPQRFIAELSKLLDLTASDAEFREIWSSIFHHETLIPEEMLSALKRRYRLVLLSNTNAIHWEMIDANYPLLNHFDHKVLSFQVGAMKPSPVIYREALQHAQADPAECFYTDDIAEYVEGAKQHGIDGVQFRSLEQLETELRARGVSW